MDKTYEEWLRDFEASNAAMRKKIEEQVVEGWHSPVIGGLGATLCGLLFAPENITTQKSKLTCEACKAELQKQTKEK